MRTIRRGRLALLLTFLAIIVASLVWTWSVGNFVFGNRLELPAESREVAVNEIRFVVPASWLFAETPSGQRGDMDIIGLATPPGSPTTWIAVIRDNEGQRDSLDDVAKWGMGRLEDKINLEIASEAVARFAQTDVVVRDYSWTSALVLHDNVPMKCRAVYALEGDAKVGYGLEMCGAMSDWGKLEDVFSRAEESFAGTLP